MVTRYAPLGTGRQSLDPWTPFTFDVSNVGTHFGSGESVMSLLAGIRRRTDIAYPEMEATGISRRHDSFNLVDPPELARLVIRLVVHTDDEAIWIRKEELTPDTALFGEPHREYSIKLRIRRVETGAPLIDESEFGTE